MNLIGSVPAATPALAPDSGALASAAMMSNSARQCSQYHLGALQGSAWQRHRRESEGSVIARETNVE